MWRDLSKLRDHWTFFTTREASLRLYLPDSCMLYYLDVISVLQPHALSRSCKLVLDGNDHTTAANLHDNVVVARENGARDCSSIPCACARDSFQGK